MAETANGEPDNGKPTRQILSRAQTPMACTNCSSVLVVCYSSAREMPRMATKKVSPPCPIFLPCSSQAMIVKVAARRTGPCGGHHPSLAVQGGCKLRILTMELPLGDGRRHHRPRLAGFTRVATNAVCSSRENAHDDRIRTCVSVSGLKKSERSSITEPSPMRS